MTHASAEARPDQEPRFREARLCLVVIDLAGFTRASAKTSALDLATFLDRHYTACAEAITRASGRVVKYMGDACFAVFPEDRCPDAVKALLELAKSMPREVERLGMKFGANAHLGVVAEGLTGPAGDRRYDVFGAEVNRLFRMGGGAGIRLSEPVFRSLPNELRSMWHKDKPPAVYSWQECG